MLRSVQTSLRGDALLRCMRQPARLLPQRISPLRSALAASGVRHVTKDHGPEKAEHAARAARDAGADSVTTSPGATGVTGPDAATGPAKTTSTASAGSSSKSAAASRSVGWDLLSELLDTPAMANNAGRQAGPGRGRRGGRNFDASLFGSPEATMPSVRRDAAGRAIPQAGAGGRLGASSAPTSRGPFAKYSGRTREVRASGGFGGGQGSDLGSAVRSLTQTLKQNNVFQDYRTQKFYEKPHDRRVRLASQRHRKRFLAGVKRLVGLVKEQRKYM